MAKRANFPDRVEKRRREATARQEAYDALPDEEKWRRNPRRSPGHIDNVTREKRREAK